MNLDLIPTFNAQYCHTNMEPLIFNNFEEGGREMEYTGVNLWLIKIIVIGYQARNLIRYKI